jgi:hypothetical protein
MPNSQSRKLRLLGATGVIRTAVFEDREHLVVPSIALVEGVVWAVNSPQPELVLASEFSVAPQGWNGRPVVADHPDNGIHKVSANTPEVLESLSFGRLFNTEIKNDQLHTEAWIDPTKAERVGKDAQSVVRRARAGEPIEISTGAFISVEPKSGTYKGKKYEAIWRGIVPDHFAMLPEGMIGACSIEMGCGAVRSASAYLITNAGLVGAFMKCQKHGVEMNAEGKCPECEKEQPKSLRQRIFDMMTFRNLKGTAEGFSDRDITQALDKALRAIEPGYLGVDRYYPEEELVVYAAMPEDKFLLLRRSYSMKTDGTAKIGENKEEVVPVTTFEAASCGCQGGNKMDKAQRIKALIEKSNGRYLETDRTWLESVPEDRLSALEASAGAKEEPKPQNPPAPPLADPAQTPPVPPTMPTNPPIPPAQPTTSAQQPPIQQGVTPQTAEQFISLAPAEIQESLREGLRASTERRNSVITALKSTNRCQFSDQELAGMSIQGLERLLALANVPPPTTFSMAGLPRATEQKPEGVPKPPSIIDEIRTARSKTH